VLQGLTLAPGQAPRARLDDTGEGLVIQQTGAEAATFNLRVQTGMDPAASAMHESVTLAAGRAVRLAPADRSAASVATAPLRTDNVGSV
jgi:hypothetical protein